MLHVSDCARIRLLMFANSSNGPRKRRADLPCLFLLEVHHQGDQALDFLIFSFRAEASARPPYASSCRLLDVLMSWPSVSTQDGKALDERGTQRIHLAGDHGTQPHT